MTATPARPYTGFIFDLDGTLIDSAPDITASVNVWLTSQGWPPVEVTFVNRFIGDGPKQLWHDLLQALALPHDDATVSAALAGYLADYRANPVRHARPYPHVLEDLRALRADGFVLGICTNKTQVIAQQVLHALELAPLFNAVVGSDSVPACKPDPVHLLRTAHHMGLDQTGWAYIGDTPIDQRTAAAAQVPFYAVPWGTGSALDVPARHRLQRLRDLGTLLAVAS